MAVPVAADRGQVAGEGDGAAERIRRCGVDGRAPAAAVERWRRERRRRELGSEVERRKEAWFRVHLAPGFEPTFRIPFFRKRM